MIIKKIRNLEDLKNCKEGEIIRRGFSRKELVLYISPSITTIKRCDDKSVQVCYYLGINKTMEKNKEEKRRYSPIIEKIYEGDGSFSYYDNNLKKAEL